METRFMAQRRRSVPHTLEDRIAGEKASLEAKAAKLTNGPEKEPLRGKIRQLDAASYMAGWLSTPGPKSPDRNA
jgi:hypothetical protein